MLDKFTKLKKKKGYDVEEKLVSKDYYNVLEKALLNSADKTVLMQIKCKDAIEMRNLSIRYVKEIELANRAIKTTDTDFYCSNEEAVTILNSINEFKELCNENLKIALNKNESTDVLCKHVHICNDIYKTFSDDFEIETEEIKNEGE